MDAVDAHHSDADEVTATTLAASRALLGLVAESIAPALETVTLPQYRVLVILHDSGPLRIGALAERLSMQPSTFSRTIDRMTTRGWVERAIGSASRREVLVRASATGIQLVESVVGRRRARLHDILATLTENEQQDALRGFQLFARAAGAPHDSTLLTLGL